MKMQKLWLGRQLIYLIALVILILAIVGVWLVITEKPPIKTVNSTIYRTHNCSELSGVCTRERDGVFLDCTGTIPTCECTVKLCTETETCSNGTCILLPEKNCDESDGGKDYTNYGVCDDDTDRFQDECINDTLLKEHYCEEAICIATEYDCSNDGKICMAGECVDEIEVLDCKSSAYPECGRTCTDGKSCVAMLGFGRPGDAFYMPDRCGCVMLCESISNPSNQSNCNPGWCVTKVDTKPKPKIKCLYWNNACVCDKDDDHDGIPDGEDPYPDDSDNDGIQNGEDDFPNDPNYAWDCEEVHEKAKNFTAADCNRGYCPEDSDLSCTYEGISGAGGHCTCLAGML